jgi:hypothetical protein
MWESMYVFHLVIGKVINILPSQIVLTKRRITKSIIWLLLLWVLYISDITNQKSIQEEIKSRLKSVNALSFGAEFFVFQFAIQKLED